MTISLGQLDLEALKNYLKIVQGFRTVDDKSGDTEFVEGIASELIAIASRNEDGKLLIDRETVNKAIALVKLDEYGKEILINADNVLTEEEGKALKESALSASVNTSNDMRALRNEMYHLKRDMIRTGNITYDPVYNGFIDPFIDNLPLYETIELVVGNQSSPLSVSVEGDIDSYTVGQYCMLVSGDSDTFLERLEEKVGNEFEFDTPFTKVPERAIKTYGLYEHGRFVFAQNIYGESLTGNNVNMIYKDGANRIKVAELNADSGITGFASMITVPAGLDGNYLNSIGVSLRVQGAPGSCQLLLYDYNESNAYLEPVASSNFLNSGLATDDWQVYQFRFDNEVKLEKGHEYLLLIKTTGTSNGNVWCVGGFVEQCNYNVHQDTYLYNGSTFVLEGPDLITNQVADMFISLYTTEVETADLKYLPKGLYTGNFRVEEGAASRVRVSFNPRLSNEYYTVIVKGKTDIDTADYIMGEQVEYPMEFPHTVWAYGKESANQFVYDFIMPERVTEIEFQIIYNNPATSVDNDTYEALYSVVVSVDDAYIKEA